MPAALLRFKRVAHEFADFAAVARSMQVDDEQKWASHPIVTRRLTAGERGDPTHRASTGKHRVSLTTDRLKVTRADAVDERVVERSRWASELDTWFSMTPPGAVADRIVTHRTSGRTPTATP